MNMSGNSDGGRSHIFVSKWEDPDFFLQSFLEFGHEHEHQKSLEGDFFSNHYWKVGGL